VLVSVYLFHSIFKIANNAAVEEELLIRNHRFTKVVIKNEFELTKQTYNYLIKYISPHSKKV